MAISSLHPKRFLQISCACAGILLEGLLTGAVVAAQPKSKPAYQFDHWTTDDGLPQNAVNAILQTRDGYLWLATYDGLVRFDGLKFTVFNRGNTKGIRGNRFDMLFENRQGALWAVTDDNWLVKYEGGAFTTYPPQNGWPSWLVVGIDEDEAGNVQVLSRNGIAKWKDGRFATDTVQNLMPTPSDAEWVQGNVLAKLDSRILYLYANGRLAKYSAQSGLPSLKITGVHVDQYGVVWITTKDVGLVRLKDDRFIVVHPSLSATPMGPVRIKEGRFSLYFEINNPPIRGDAAPKLEDRKGNIWFTGIGNWLGRLQNGRITQYRSEPGFLASSTMSFCEDREGNFWIGTAYGLYRAREATISVYTQQDGLSSDNLYSIREDQAGSLWFGSWGGGVTKYQDGRFTSYQTRHGLASDLITSLYDDREGDMWIGTTFGLNLFKKGQLSSYPDPEGFFGDGAWAIHRDRAGGLWFGTTNGLIKLEAGRYTRYTKVDGLAGDDVKAILEDRAGHLWFGTWSGLTRYADGHFKSYTEQDGLASDHIRTLYEDAEGILWIGTYDGGLGRFKDGRFTRYTTNEGLFNNGVFQIIEDERGYFWMSCNKGIYSVARQELNDFAAGKIRSITSIAYGKKDGLLSVECNGGRQPAGWKTRDGRLWFPTAKGAAVVDPSRIEINRLPPALVIEEILLNNESVGSGPVIEIRPEKNGNLEIRYQGLSFVRPEQQRYRYRLAGIDNDWVEADNRRAAYYSHLPPGDYAFTVIAANSDGVWNETGKSVRVIVVAPVWRRWWFISLTIVTVLSLAAFAYRRRVSRLEKEKAMQEALAEQLKKEKAMQENFSRQLIESQESERQRIASELHDGLGQDLLIVKNCALVGLNMAKDASMAKKQFDEISEMTSQVLEDVREITHDLRPYHLDRLGLKAALEFMIEKVTNSSEIRFSSEIATIDGLVPKVTEMHLYRIVQESVNNIVKHSGATEAKVALKREGNSLQLKIEDNGKGFNSSPPVSGSSPRGFGLSGISERVRILGGRELIDSIAGRGTKITVTIKLPDQEPPDGHHE
jgi:signal transduction histidine kinase/ligand-binding sensor domain-containing protein